MLYCAQATSRLIFGEMSREHSNARLSPGIQKENKCSSLEFDKLKHTCLYLYHIEEVIGGHCRTKRKSIGLLGGAVLIARFKDLFEFDYCLSYLRLLLASSVMTDLC